jgi:Flp pilus assembly protein TadG
MFLYKEQRGAALVELAIVMVVLLTITFGITEFGRAIYQYNTLAKSARDAARYLSTKGQTDTDAKAAAKCLAVFGKPFYGDPTCGGSTSTLAPGLTIAMVSVCDALACPTTHSAQGTAPVVNLVTVTIGGAATPYTFASAVSFAVPDIPFGEISVTMRQVL